MILTIEVEGEKKNLYVDNELYNRLGTKIKPKLKKKDFDWVWVVDGSEGSGKSVFSMQLARVVDPSFCLERVCMTPEEFTKAVIKAEQGQAVVFDEGFTGLSSRASLTEINRLMVSLMMEMRQKNLFIIVVMPTIFLLDRYVALFRARGLFHVYMKGGKRGRWVYFNNKSKKQLYIYGKKLFSYAKPRSNFRGRFSEQYVLNEEAYRKKKAENLAKKTRSTRAEVFKYQRDILFYIMNRKLKIFQEEISSYCKELGYKIEQNTISDAIINVDTQLLKKENT